MKGNFVVADDPDDPKAIKAKAEGQKVRYRQPRDEDGQFTYNSANAKHLYYGKKSRGTTQLPFADKIKEQKDELNSSRRDVVVGADKLSYVFSVDNITTAGIKEALTRYIRNSKAAAGKEGYSDYLGTRKEKDVIKGHSLKKGKESAEEKAAKEKGFVGKVGENWDVGGRKRYKYNKAIINKFFNPINSTKYFDENNLPLGMDLGKPSAYKDLINTKLGFTDPIKQEEKQENTPDNNNNAEENKDDLNLDSKIDENKEQNIDVNAANQELASKNPSKFYAQNKEKVDSIANHPAVKAEGITKEDIIAAIGEGATFEDLEEMIKNN